MGLPDSVDRTSGHTSFVRILAGISLILGVWLFAAWTVSLTYLYPMVGYSGYNSAYWTFMPNEQIMANILFFITSLLALVFGAFVAFVGRAYRILSLKIAGILYAFEYLIFIVTVIFGILWIGSFFSYDTVLPFASYLSLYYSIVLPSYSIVTPSSLNFVIPIVVSLIPLFSFCLGVHALKKKSDIPDLDGVIFFLIVGVILVELVSALGYMVFAYSLHRISVEETRSGSSV
jgi:hypothetical protein